ncbi:glycosyltransferase family 2 protein [Sphingomonas telluris]|uniref:glycosyltransferase family 2 protein n=1 Tax=Sphingomonas telluris TaxID=2907998 RepID=UPI00344EBC71
MADQDPGTDLDAAVAVVIPCYRQAHLIRGAIESALLQSVPPAEIILVDDGSDDDLQSVACSYPQVTFLQQGNRGLAAARNAGLRAAASDKVIFLDADDLLLPDAVASGLACFSAFPDAGFVLWRLQRGKGRRAVRAAEFAANPQRSYPMQLDRHDRQRHVRSRQARRHRRLQ